MRQIICAAAFVLWACIALPGATVATEDGLAMQIQEADASRHATRCNGPLLADRHQAVRPAMSRLPIARLSGEDWGLTMAQPMDVPRFFPLAYEQPYGFQIEYEFGLSPITWKFRNRAPFQFLLYRHDPAWGLRSASRR